MIKISLEKVLLLFFLFFAATLLASLGAQFLLDGRLDVEKAVVVSLVTSCLLSMIFCWRSIRRAIPLPM